MKYLEKRELFTKFESKHGFSYFIDLNVSFFSIYLFVYKKIRNKIQSIKKRNLKIINVFTAPKPTFLQ